MPNEFQLMIVIVCILLLWLWVFLAWLLLIGKFLAAGVIVSILLPATLAIVQRHAPDFDGTTMEMRASTGGKYVSLTCTITATSKPQLDALYRELSGHPLVKVVL